MGNKPSIDPWPAGVDKTKVDAAVEAAFDPAGMTAAFVVTGPTGNPSGRIVRALCERGAGVRAPLRKGTEREKLERLWKLGATVAREDRVRSQEVRPVTHV
jgi:hypothetical protein